MHTNLFVLAAFASIALAQYTSTTQAVSEIADGQPQAPTARPGSMTVTSYYAHSPGYTPSWVDTATMPAYSGAPSSSSNSSYSMKSTSYVVPTQPGTNYNSTHVPIVTASGSPANNYTMASSTLPAPGKSSSISSALVVAATSTGPTIPISSTNAGALDHVAGPWLALVGAGSVFAVLL